MWLACDLDDTLIPNAEGMFEVLHDVRDYIASATGVNAEDVAAVFREERQALPGYGRVHFVNSSINTYWRLKEQPSNDELCWIVTRATEAFDAEPAPYPGVLESLRTLSHAGSRIVIFTMGDPAIQSAKIMRSGIYRYIEDVEIVPHKDTEAMRRLAARLGKIGLMVGNSPANDIAPAIALKIPAIQVGKAVFPSELIDIVPGDVPFYYAPTFVDALPLIRRQLDL